MKRVEMVAAVLLLTLGWTLTAAAQSHDDHERGTVGVYFDYMRLHDSGSNLFGIGGRIGINDHKHLAFEGEFAYDFNHESTATTCFGSGCAVGIFDVTKSNIQAFHGLFGPKVQTAGRVRLFGELKGGFVHLDTKTTLTLQGNPLFMPVIASISETHGALFPGGGVEFLRDRWGVRLDAGDEIFWSDKAHHNFKLMAGPVFRF
jgi:hypothetical protein